MLLGNKKVQKSEQNWCLILNPLYNEIDKRKVSRKISETFTLSTEEADDLVNNTPIILLDNLSHETASQVKDFFRPTGAELLMTNEVYLKRKCYRTVWPEPPSLSFLATEVPEPERPKSESHRLHPDEALEEMRTLSDKDEEEQDDEETFAPEDHGQAQAERESLRQELERIKKERDNWREKYDTQRRTSEKLGWELTSHEQGRKGADEKLSEELERQKELLENEQERYEELDEEYGQARSVFEEKLLAATRDAATWKNKAAEFEQLKQKQDEEKAILQKRFLEQESRLESWKKRNEVLEEELSSIKFSRNASESQMKTNDLRLAELEQQEGKLKADLRKAKDLCHDMESRYHELQNEIEQGSTAAQEELADVREKARIMEKNQMRLVNEIEARGQEAKEWEKKSREFEKKIQELQHSHENLEKMLHVNLKQLEAREKELDLTRRQLSDIKTHREQQDAVQKREQLVALLTDKESRLKGLVQEQERVETEIRSREERINQIMVEQEKVEKEILDAKQASRHYLEQIKKEQTPRLKISGRRSVVSKPAGEEPVDSSDD